MSREEIVAELRRRPDDEQVWSVFGDLLADAGDPHGELIALDQRAAASPAGFVRAELEHRARVLFTEHQRAWLEPLADAGLELEWYRGFITKATVAREHRRLVAALLELPVAALVRELVVVRPPSVRTVVAELGATPLTSFELHVRDQTDLTELARLVSLRELVVEGSSTEGLAELAALPALERLELRRFHGELDGFGHATWPWLRSLALTAREGARALGPDALAPLADLTELRELDLHDGGWTELWPLARASALEFLDLRSTDIVSVEPLAPLSRLRRLALGGCAELTNLAPLADLSELTRLELRYTRVRDLGPLRGLTKLEILDLSGTPVHKLGPLFELPALRRVIVEACEVDDIGPLLDRGVKVVGVRPPPPSWRELADRLLS